MKKPRKGRGKLECSLFESSKSNFGIVRLFEDRVKGEKTEICMPVVAFWIDK